MTENSPAPSSSSATSDGRRSSRDIGQDRAVTVVGAGFSGLAAAFHLRRAGFKVEVIEKSQKPGGLISTLDLPQGRVETAANGMLNSAYVEELFEAIGLPIAGTKKESRKRFVFREGRPRRWPLGFFATLSLLRFFFCAIFFRSSVTPRDGETVSQWGARVMGEEASRYTAETFLQGIYAGDATRMSASVIFGRFLRKALPGRQSPARPAWTQKRPRKRHQKHPQIRGTVSAPEGMGQVIQALRSHLESEGVRFSFHNEFAQTQVEPLAEVQPLVIATPAYEAARLLMGQDSERAQALARVEFLPVLTSTVFFKEPIANAQGFGCLMPPSENHRMLGVLMNSFIYEGRSRQGYSETWIMGGAVGQKRMPELFSLSDEQIVRVIQEEREACFGARGEILAFKVTRWPVALPHYTTEFEQVLPRIRENRENVFLIGNYLGQIGLAKILELAAQLPAEVARQGAWDQRSSQQR